jgi:hypothetical protein
MQEWVVYINFGGFAMLHRTGQSAELANIALLLTPIGQYHCLFGVFGVFVKLVIISLGVLIGSTGFTPIRGPWQLASLTADLVAVTRQRLTTLMFYTMIGSFLTSLRDTQRLS